MQLRKAGRMSFAPAFRLSFPDSTFQDSVSHLAVKPAVVDILCKTLGIEDGKDTPLVRLQLWIRLPWRIWSRPSNFERRRTLLPSLDDSEGCDTPFDFSKNLCCSQHLRLLPTQHVASSKELSQAVAQVAQAGRSKPVHRNVFGSATTSIQ